MSKRISSSDWTGPTDKTVRRGAFTHRIGEHAIASDYQRLLAARLEAERVPPEVMRVKTVAAALLISPLLLWLAWLLVGFVIGDPFLWKHTHLLVFWGLGVMALAAWQISSRSRVLVGLRRLFLFGLLAATVILSLGFIYLGMDARSNAIAAVPERTFELSKAQRKRPFRQVVRWHQRVDGSSVEGGRRAKPLAYASTCALVQRFEAPYGFSWVKVIDRSRPPGRGQLIWPIRREDCFSGKPLSTLPL